MATNDDQKGSRPVPDPTLLTTQQLLREIAQLRDEFGAQFGALRAELAAVNNTSADARTALRTIIETRLDAMDKAIELLQATADRFPHRMDEKIAALANVHDEKFRSVERQFTERDVRTEQTSRDSKVAVDAALQAAKEAVGEQNRSGALAIAKSETATDKRIDQMGLLITSTTKATDDKIDDLKQRLTRIEGKGEGTSASIGWILAGVASLVGIASLVFAVMK